MCCLMRDGVLFVNCSIFFVLAAAISLTEEYLNIKHLFICWISVAKTITFNILAHVDQLLQSASLWTMINFLVELIWIVPIPCRENVKYFFKYHHKKNVLCLVHDRDLVKTKSKSTEWFAPDTYSLFLQTEKNDN